MSRLIALCRPETGAVRCEHLVAKHDVSIFIQSKFKFCVRNDNAASKCIFRTLFIKSNRVVTDLLRIFSAFSRIIFFQMRNTLLKGNILIVISDLSLCGRRIDRLRQLVRLLQSLRKADATDLTGLLIACPAAARDVATHNALDRNHVQLPAQHAVPVKFLLLEKFRHILDICRDHVVRKDILREVEPEF